MDAPDQILMCSPKYYGIEYEINPWMKTERQADHELALRQWQSLKHIFEELGVQILELEPVAGLPDLVFTANAAIIHKQTAVVSRFRHVQRRGEEEHNERWLLQHGFQLKYPPGAQYVEGAGDALFCGDTLFAGYRMRSDAAGLQDIGRIFGCRVIPLELVDKRYYHLDTCFCPLKPGQTIYYPAAFDSYGRKVLTELVDDLIEVESEEACHFSCNAGVVGETVVTNEGCPKMHRQLKRRGYRVIETPLSEFVKAGGSAKCLTLRLDGEDAASWTAETEE
jgi:N-dimethylarginine dimethylaminohydrolase